MLAQRLLLALALVLLLAVAPPALARAEGAPANDRAGCVDPGDADADNVPEEDLCSTERGGGTSDPCAPPPPTGDQPAGGTGDQQAGESDDDPAEQPPADDGETEESPDDDELDLPIEAAREYRDFCEEPVFDQGFLRRAWRFGGDASSFSGGVLTLTVRSTPRVPARFREQAGRLAGLEFAVVVSRRTRLVSAGAARRSSRRGRRSGGRRVTERALRQAGRVRVDGKLLPPSRWRRDADGRRVPTVRASKITLGG
jgi:hypothetical protein